MDTMTKVQQLVDAIKAERKAAGYSDDAMMSFTLGYLMSYLASTIDEMGKQGQKKAIEMLDWSIDFNRNKTTKA